MSKRRYENPLAMGVGLGSIDEPSQPIELETMFRDVHPGSGIRKFSVGAFLIPYFFNIFFSWLPLILLATLLLWGLAHWWKFSLSWLWALLTVLATLVVTGFFEFYFYAMVGAWGMPELIAIALALGTGYLIWYLMLRRACRLGWAKSLGLFAATMLFTGLMMRGLGYFLRVIQ